MKYLALVIGIAFFQKVYAQTANKQFAFGNDTLAEVTVHAFMLNNKWKEAPAAVAIISHSDIEKTAPTSLLPAINSVAGVRMEERSPGSYRLSIRGSTLRSPFGVRNVKVYWNNIPITDGGGNTYLNLIDVSQINSMEIIKGPSSSVYGAGTGGVLLMNSLPNFSNEAQHHVTAGITGGSYGLMAENTGYTYQNKQFASTLQQSHLQSNSYRQQSAVRRDTYNWVGKWQTNSQTFNVLAYYTNMYYQTPGGLTLAEMLKNPTSARPPSGNIPGAVQQKSAIYDKTGLVGVHHTWKISSTFSNEATVMLNHNAITNPFLTKYENRDETNTGLSEQFIYRLQKKQFNITWINGGEWLYNHSRIDDYNNLNGVAGAVQFKDNLFANQWYLFSQLQIKLYKLIFNAGLSYNNQLLSYRRLTDTSMLHDLRTQSQQVITPRFSVSYAINSAITWYGIAAKGFSPPTLAEFFPQDRIFHSELKPEYGWNFETGFKGSLLNNALQFDVAAYRFQLQNAIVMRINAQGQQYFVNAGGAMEKGVEVTAHYKILQQPNKLIKRLSVWGSYSYQPYHFYNYKQGNTEYSGNSVTGVPKNNFSGGIDMDTRNAYYLHILLFAAGAIPLNDANSVYANSYQNLQLKMGKNFQWGNWQLNAFVGADNVLNQQYSLGNDINAAGGRYYNPAPLRNFYVGCQLQL